MEARTANCNFNGLFSFKLLLSGFQTVLMKKVRKVSPSSRSVPHLRGRVYLLRNIATCVNFAQCSKANTFLDDLTLKSYEAVVVAIV